MRVKIMCLAMVVALAGCGMLGYVCAPTADQKQTADNIETFIASGVVAIVPLVVKDSKGNPVTVDPTQVVQTMETVKQGGCALANDLTLALNWFQAITHPAVNPASVKMKAMAMGVVVPDTTPLWNWIGKPNPYVAQ